MNIPVNMPADPARQMQLNTKEFREYLNALEFSHYHRADYPYSCYTVVSTIVISFSFIILIYYIKNFIKFN